MVANSCRSILNSKVFTRKDYEDWDGNCTWHFKLTTAFSVKLTPNFYQKQAAPGLIWPKWHVQMVADCCRSIPKSKFVHEQGYKPWNGNSTGFSHPNTPFSAKPIPKFGQKRTNWWVLWPKSHMCMIVDGCRSIPKSKLVHKHTLESLGWESYVGF